MSTKNPFEIRFDVLAMAKELCDKAYEQQQSVFWEMVNDARAKQADTQEIVDKYIPKMYQPSEIFEKAEELYKFVTKKD
jgi:hypothetical protein